MHEDKIRRNKDATDANIYRNQKRELRNSFSCIKRPNSEEFCTLCSWITKTPFTAEQREWQWDFRTHNEEVFDDDKCVMCDRTKSCPMSWGYYKKIDRLYIKVLL